jgi:hypothetical protein
MCVLVDVSKYFTVFSEERVFYCKCCISIFGVFINGWMFTDGYIAAIRNLGLARFRFVVLKNGVGRFNIFF